MRFLSHNVRQHLCLLREARKCALLKILGLTIAIEKQQVSWTLWGMKVVKKICWVISDISMRVWHFLVTIVITKQQHSHIWKKHTESVHEGGKYPCSQCNHKATTQSSLKIHIESVHEGVKYPCSQCFYKAIQQHHLKRHIDSKHKC